MFRLGIIGCGRVTTMFHLKAIEGLEDVTVEAVSDVSEDRMREVQGGCASAKPYGDYVKLLEDPEVDAVVINTPPKFHEKMVLDALGHGKHALCEKPLAQSVEGCRRIGDAQRAAGLQVLPAHNYAFTPSVLRMVEMVKRGDIGGVEHMQVHFGTNLRMYGSKTDFRTGSEDGLVEDVLPHILSVSMPFAGRPSEVKDLAWRCSQYKVCDNMRATLETEAGVEIDSALSWTKLMPQFKVVVEGTEGRLETDLMIGPYTVAVDRGGRRETLKERGVDWYLDLVRFRHPSFKNQYAHFARLVGGLEPPMITVEDEAAILGCMGKMSRLLGEVPRSG